MTFLRLTLATLVAAAGIAVLPAVAHACSCVRPPPPQKAVADYDAVFSGTVVAVDNPQARARIVSSGGPVHYTFEVDAIAKGPRAQTIEVSSALGSASCGAGLRKGHRYLVFAYYGSGFKRTQEATGLWTNLCTPTERLGPDEALPVAARSVSTDIVGPPLSPPAPGPSGPLAAAAATSLAAAVVALVVLLLRSRSAPAP